MPSDQRHVGPRPLISALCREVQAGGMSCDPLRSLLGRGDGEAGIGQVRGPRSLSGRKDMKDGGDCVPGVCPGTSQPGCRRIADVPRGGW